MSVQWCDTKVGVITTQFEWTLDKNPYHLDPDCQQIRSLPFGDASSYNNKWILIYKKDHQESFKVLLTLESKSPKFQFKYNLEVINEFGNKLKNCKFYLSVLIN